MRASDEAIMQSRIMGAGPHARFCLWSVTRFIREFLPSLKWALFTIIALNKTLPYVSIVWNNSRTFQCDLFPKIIWRNASLLMKIFKVSNSWKSWCLVRAVIRIYSDGALFNHRDKICVFLFCYLICLKMKREKRISVETLDHLLSKVETEFRSQETHDESFCHVHLSVRPSAIVFLIRGVLLAHYSTLMLKFSVMPIKL